MSKKVIILIVIAVAIIGIVIYMKNRKARMLAEAEGQAKAGVTGTADTTTVSADTLIDTIVGEADPVAVTDGSELVIEDSGIDPMIGE